MSITDRCDFACVYCRPTRSDGYADHRLDLAAWETMFQALFAGGVRRVRFTGGEPLLHREVVDLVAMAAGIGFEDVALTTNASRLVKLADPLRRAGLMRLNVSIDSLDETRFAELTRGGKLASVLDGLSAAADAGLFPIKLNTVVLRDINDDELERIVQYAWQNQFVPRFLEVMPIAEGARYAASHLVTVDQMRRRLAHLIVAEQPTPELDRGPATYVAASHPAHRGQRVGFISGTSDTFCASCDRLRVSATGMLRPCLATEDGVDGSLEARDGDHAGLQRRLLEAWAQKPDGNTWKGCTEETARSVSMRAIGG